MTTVAQLAASGRGRIAVALDIPGVGVFTTLRGWTPSGAWYTAAGYDSTWVHPWLVVDSVARFSDDIDINEAELTVPDITVEIANVDDQLMALLADFRVWTYSRLTASLAAGHTTSAEVENSDDFDASGDVYCGGEWLHFASKADATHLTTLVRGKYGTQDLDHDVDLASTPAKRPVVADGVHDLVGKRANLYMAVQDPADGTMGATTCIYRGRIGDGGKAVGTHWELSVESVSDVLYQHVGQRLPSSAVHRQQYWYSGSDAPAGVSGTRVRRWLAGVTTAQYLEINSGRYSPTTLAIEWTRMIRDSGITAIDPVATFVGDSRCKIHAPATADNAMEFEVREGDPLWALGFAPGVYNGEVNTEREWEADDEPRLLVIDTSDRDGTRPRIHVEDSSVFTTGLAVQVPGSAFNLVHSVGSDPDYVDLSARGWDLVRPSRFIAVEKDEDLVLRHVFAIGNRSAADITDAMKAFLGLDAARTEPSKWCAMGLTAADIDFDELDDALSSVPGGLNQWQDCVTKPTKLWDILGTALSVLGICPRITADAKIGFFRIQTPIVTLAEAVEVDSEIWALAEASATEASLGHNPLLNLVEVAHSYDYRAKDSKDSWGAPAKIFFDDGINQLGRVRSISKKVSGWQVGPRGRAAASIFELAVKLEGQLDATHFGPFGRLSGALVFDCCWKAKQLTCGMYVLLTHPHAPDLAQGETGIADRMALIIGRTGQIFGDDNDELVLMLPPVSNGAGLAPAALATSYDQGSKTLTFADVDLYAQSGDSDLDGFVAADEILAQECDSASPNTDAGTIASMGVSTMVLTADVFGATFAADYPEGAVITLCPWDDATATQEAWAYFADEAAVSTLGAAGDAAKEWTI